MVDLPTAPSPAEGESSKFRKLMSSGKPAGILKSKFLTVLGNSNELLNRISNKLEETLDLSSDSDYCDDDEEVPDDESVDLATIDFDARKVKARRAHEEIISGRYRNPNLIPRMTQNKLIINGQKQKLPSSSSSSSSVSASLQSKNDDPSNNNSKANSLYNNSIESKSSIDENQHHNNDIETLEISATKMSSQNQQCQQLDGIVMNLNETPAIDIIPPPVEQQQQQQPQSEIINNDNHEDETTLLAKSIAVVNVFNQHSPITEEEFQRNFLKKTSNSSTLTSLNDPLPASGSIESSDLKNWIRSDSQNSDPSWASSISLDGEIEENCKEFMKQFVDIIFTNSSTITVELKSEFGIHARTENGRLWFARYLNAQRIKSKRVDETTFYSLVQYFAILLFECNESEDYSPAKSLMNMCFTFYHDIEVPGCEPYREYLFTYLRQQPIWHTLRFWNAAFFDALQCERAHRPVPKNSKNKNNKNNNESNTTKQHINGADTTTTTTTTTSINDGGGGDVVSGTDSNTVLEKTNKNNLKKFTNDKNNEVDNDDDVDDDDDHDDGHNDDSSSASEHNENAIIQNDEFRDDIIFQQTITFGQLGTFTCNMHAFGLSRDLCLEFLRKQSTIANLHKDQIKLIRDNINRMYLETEKWGA